MGSNSSHEKIYKTIKQTCHVYNSFDNFVLFLANKFHCVTKPVQLNCVLVFFFQELEIWFSQFSFMDTLWPFNWLSLCDQACSIKLCSCSFFFRSWKFDLVSSHLWIPSDLSTDYILKSLWFCPFDEAFYI